MADTTVANRGATTSQAVHIGTGEVYAVPSRTEAEKVYGVTVTSFEGKVAYFCNCLARAECWHIREVQLAEQIARPKLQLVPAARPAGLDFSADEPWDLENNCPIGAN
jgi:hypothetical protein